MSSPKHPDAAAPACEPSPPFGRQRTWPRALGSALLAASLLFTGCTSSKYKNVSAKNPPPAPVPINAPLGDDPVTATLNTVIVYKGPGSWKKEAFWDEYALTLRNASSEPVTIDRATLLDYAGTGHDAGSHPWKLEARSKSLERKYADAGIAFVRYAGPVAVLGAVGVGAAYTAAASFALGGGAAVTTTATAAAATSTVLIPVYLVTVISINTSRRHAIEREFNHRRLALPLVLLPGEERSGSLFFPMTPSPQALTLGWRKPAGSGTMRAPLAMLSALHLNPAGKTRRPASESAAGATVAAGSP
jgi:hypothetical protein